MGKLSGLKVTVEYIERDIRTPIAILMPSPLSISQIQEIALIYVTDKAKSSEIVIKQIEAFHI